MPNENWTSADNCTNFTCEKFGDQYSVLSVQETCPALEYCPEDRMYVKGCCKLCNITSDSKGKNCKLGIIWSCINLMFLQPYVRHKWYLWQKLQELLTSLYLDMDYV